MDAGTYQGFEVAIEQPGIAVVRLNQPERLNGLTSLLKRDLAEVLLQAQVDDGVRIVVITGSGRAFCAGDDITGRTPHAGDGRPLMQDIATPLQQPIDDYAFLRAISQPLTAVLRGLDKPTVAAINGVAIQSGLSLALACDFRIAGESARLGSATLRFGLLPDEGGQYLLVQHLGLAKALDFVLRKRILTAADALAWGLVHEVAPDDEVLPRALDLARELAEGPQVATRLLKRSLYNAAALRWEEALEEIAAKAAIADHHPDAREGVAAFREKRAPRFNEAIPARPP